MFDDDILGIYGIISAAQNAELERLCKIADERERIHNLIFNDSRTWKNKS